MKRLIGVVVPLFLTLAISLWALPGADSSATIPHLVKFSGVITAPAGESTLIFALYADQTGGAPLWQETQSVAVDASGHYTVLLGARNESGIPVELFSSNEARWLGVQVQGQAEQPRVLLVSVPYAMKAADAETLGGLPASAFLRTSDPAVKDFVNNQAIVAAANTAASAATSITATNAQPNVFPIFTDTTGDLGPSVLTQVVTPTTTYLGFGTTNPLFNLHFVSTVDPAALTIEGYGTLVGINFMGRRARGTPASPQALQKDDNIMAMQGRGYGATAFSPYSRAYMKFFAAENWTDTAQGSYITMATTLKGTSPAASATERLRITDAGWVGLGTTTAGVPIDQMLTVAGSVHLTAGGIVFPDNSTLNSANSVVVTGAPMSGEVTINDTSTKQGADALTVTTAAPGGSAIVGTSSSGVAGSDGLVGSGVSGRGTNGATGLYGTSDTGLALVVDGVDGSYGDALITGLIENGNELIGAPVDNGCVGCSAPPPPYMGMMLRRFVSDPNSPSYGSVVAYVLVDNTNTAGVSLERETTTVSGSQVATADGFKLVPDTGISSSIYINYACQGFDSTGAAKNVAGNFNVATGYAEIYPTGSGVMFFHCIFGRANDAASMTEVSATRYSSSSSSWIGTIISDTNQ